MAVTAASGEGTEREGERDGELQTPGSCKQHTVHYWMLDAGSTGSLQEYLFVTQGKPSSSEGRTL